VNNSFDWHSEPILENPLKKIGSIEKCKRKLGKESEGMTRAYKSGARPRKHRRRKSMEGVLAGQKREALENAAKRLGFVKTRDVNK